MLRAYCDTYASAMGLPHVEGTGYVQRRREFINRQSSFGPRGGVSQDSLPLSSYRQDQWWPNRAKQGKAVN